MQRSWLKNHTISSFCGKKIERLGKTTELSCCGEDAINHENKLYGATTHRLVGKRKEGCKWIWVYKCMKCGATHKLGSSHRNFNVVA
jgi:DNA-directed RNA polymerase subunit RPC12/RpoP